MIGSVRGRSEFDLIGRTGRRVYAATLWCNWCRGPDPTNPRVAFAITRAYGSAVQRNRLRRRVRHVLNELDRTEPLPPVLMLFGTRSRRSKNSARMDETHRPNEQVFEQTFLQVHQDVNTIIELIRSDNRLGPASNA